MMSLDLLPKYRKLLKNYVNTNHCTLEYSDPQLVNGGMAPPPRRGLPGTTCFMVIVSVNNLDFFGFGPTAALARYYAEKDAYKAVVAPDMKGGKEDGGSENEDDYLEQSTDQIPGDLNGIISDGSQAVSRSNKSEVAQPSVSTNTDDAFNPKAISNDKDISCQSVSRLPVPRNDYRILKKVEEINAVLETLPPVHQPPDLVTWEHQMNIRKDVIDTLYKVAGKKGVRVGFSYRTEFNLGSKLVIARAFGRGFTCEGRHIRKYMASCEAAAKLLEKLSQLPDIDTHQHLSSVKCANALTPVSHENHLPPVSQHPPTQQYHQSDRVQPENNTHHHVNSIPVHFSKARTSAPSIPAQTSVASSLPLPPIAPSPSESLSSTSSDKVSTWISSNPVGQLNELLSKEGLDAATYAYVCTSSANFVEFCCTSSAKGLSAKGVGSSKKLAKRHAAENLLSRMESQGMNIDPQKKSPVKKTKVLLATPPAAVSKQNSSQRSFHPPPQVHTGNTVLLSSPQSYNFGQRPVQLPSAPLPFGPPPASCGRSRSHWLALPHNHHQSHSLPPSRYHLLPPPTTLLSHHHLLPPPTTLSSRHHLLSPPTPHPHTRPTPHSHLQLPLPTVYPYTQLPLPTPHSHTHPAHPHSLPRLATHYTVPSHPNTIHHLPPTRPPPTSHPHKVTPQPSRPHVTRIQFSSSESESDSDSGQISMGLKEIIPVEAHSSQSRHSEIIHPPNSRCSDVTDLSNSFQSLSTKNPSTTIRSFASVEESKVKSEHQSIKYEQKHLPMPGVRVSSRPKQPNICSINLSSKNSVASTSPPASSTKHENILVSNQHKSDRGTQANKRHHLEEIEVPEDSSDPLNFYTRLPKKRAKPWSSEQPLCPVKRDKSVFSKLRRKELKLNHSFTHQREPMSVRPYQPWVLPDSEMWDSVAPSVEEATLPSCVSQSVDNSHDVKEESSVDNVQSKDSSKVDVNSFPVNAPHVNNFPKTKSSPAKVDGHEEASVNSNNMHNNHQTASQAAPTLIQCQTSNNASTHCSPKHKKINSLSESGSGNRTHNAQSSVDTKPVSQLPCHPLLAMSFTSHKSPGDVSSYDFSRWSTHHRSACRNDIVHVTNTANLKESTGYSIPSSSLINPHGADSPDKQQADKSTCTGVLNLDGLVNYSVTNELNVTLPTEGTLPGISGTILC